MRTIITRRAAVALLTLSMAALAAGAEEPVRLIVPFPAGGGLDALGRLVADRLRPMAPASTFVVENRAGANGNLGAAAVARAAPDGNTLLMSPDSVVTVNPKLYENSGFAPSDLAPIALLATQTSVLVVPSTSSITTVEQFVAESRRREMSYASGGVGSAGHLTMAYLASLTGSKMLHVPFTGGAPAVLALVGGQVDAAFLALPGALAQIKAGKLRALSVSSTPRSPSLPDVPSLAETPDFKGFEVVTAYLAMAPARTPPDVQARWGRMLADIAKASDFKSRMIELGMEQQYLNAEATIPWLARERTRWETLIRQQNITAR